MKRKPSIVELFAAGESVRDIVISIWNRKPRQTVEDHERIERRVNAAIRKALREAREVDG